MGMEAPAPGREFASSAGRLNPPHFIVAQFDITRASLAHVAARMLTFRFVSKRFKMLHSHLCTDGCGDIWPKFFYEAGHIK